MASIGHDDRPPLRRQANLGEKLGPEPGVHPDIIAGSERRSAFGDVAATDATLRALTPHLDDTPARGPLPDPLQSALAAVVELVREAHPGVIGVQLAGSLARDEAMVVSTGSDWTIENDVDLVALVDSPGGHRSTAEIAREAARLLHCDGVDLAFWPADAATGAEINVLNVDLRHASRCLWGQDLAPLLPDSITAAALPSREALKLSLNRLHCLLEAHPRRARPESYLRRQLTKSIEGVVESSLILRGEYHPSYVEKAARFARLDDVDVARARASEWALANRLAANRSVESAPSWATVRDATLWALANALAATTGKRVSGWRRGAARVFLSDLKAVRARGSVRNRVLGTARAVRLGLASAAQVLVAASAVPPHTSAVRAAGSLLGRPWGGFDATLERSLRAWFRAHYGS
jgi:hypothetical protein